jgi:natural product precursor
MKKLGKIHLKNALILEEQEMKRIYGGSGSGWCCFSDGECVLTGCTSSSQCQTWYGEGTCK